MLKDYIKLFLATSIFYLMLIVSVSSQVIGGWKTPAISIEKKLVEKLGISEQLEASVSLLQTEANNQNEEFEDLYFCFGKNHFDSTVCSGHGQCYLGTCQCHSGYSGGECESVIS